MKNLENKKYWFVNKTYGYGWVPNTWEGWVVLILYFVSITSLIIFFDLDKREENFPFLFMFSILLPTIILLLICYKTGEKLKWRWGNKSDKSE